jgi:hypothetical protein
MMLISYTHKFGQSTQPALKLKCKYVTNQRNYKDLKISLTEPPKFTVTANNSKGITRATKEKSILPIHEI